MIDGPEQTLPLQQVRAQWRAVLDAARYENVTTVITYHDQPVGILTPPRSRGEGGESEEVGVADARKRLRELVDTVRLGRTLTIVRYGVAVAQLTPYRRP